MAARKMPPDSRVNMSSHMLKVHTKADTVRNRPTQILNQDLGQRKLIATLYYRSFSKISGARKHVLDGTVG